MSNEMKQGQNTFMSAQYGYFHPIVIQKAIIFASKTPKGEKKSTVHWPQIT